MSKIKTIEKFLDEKDMSMYPFHIALIKEYAELVRAETLKVAAEEANMLGVTQHNNGALDRTSDFVYVVDSNGPDFGYTVNKQSILDLATHKNLEIL